MQKGDDGGVTELIVSNLPTQNGNGNTRVQIKARLTQLGNNCRGRVVRLMQDGRALIRFPNREAMLRSAIVIIYSIYEFMCCFTHALVAMSLS